MASSIPPRLSRPTATGRLPGVLLPVKASTGPAGVVVGGRKADVGAPGVGGASRGAVIKMERGWWGVEGGGVGATTAGVGVAVPTDVPSRVPSGSVTWT